MIKINSKKSSLNIIVIILGASLFYSFILFNKPNESTDLEEVTADVQETSITETSEITNSKIDDLIKIAMDFYNNNGDFTEVEEIFKGHHFQSKYDVMELAFKNAIELDSYNLDLKYALASTKVFKRDIHQALQIYKQIYNLDPTQFNALLLYSIYSKVNGDEAEYKKKFQQLYEIDKVKAINYEKKINNIESIKTTPLHTEIPIDLTHNHVFIILGYALSEDGKMEEPLIKRLQIGLQALRKNPKSKVIVTGGIPKNGITEADAMYDWLVANGIDKERIIKENKATDTVGNALHSMEIVQQEDFKSITLISSTNHMRRALVVFNEANSQFNNRSEIKDQTHTISHIVYMDEDSQENSELISHHVNLAIYRDFLRTSGIWSFPGMQR